MPVCTIYLFALTRTCSIPQFLHQLSSSIAVRPLVVAKCVRWMITPERLGTDPLITTKPLWDILLIVQGRAGVPSTILADRFLLRHHYMVQAGVPSTIVSSFHTTNQRLLHPQNDDIPPLTGSLDQPLVAASGQKLEFTQNLYQWMKSDQAPHGAVSMLNLLAFNPGMHDEYAIYGKEFGARIGRRRGGRAKIVGRVTGGQGEQDGWEEIALAHYPSIQHFADMAASKDYQEVNHKHRIPALKDTCILCTSELQLEWPADHNKHQSKL